MARRKFYYGDLAEINELSETSHGGHVARILGTVIRTYNGRSHSAVYRVMCECGSPLTLAARKLSYTDRSDFPLSLEESYKRGFLRELGVHDPKDEEQLTDQVERILVPLPERTRTVLRRRFGLNPDGTKETFQSIADTYGITRERVRQIATRSMRKLAGKKTKAVA